MEGYWKVFVLIGIQNNVREKMLKGQLDAFTTESAYVKFEKAVF